MRHYALAAAGLAIAAPARAEFMLDAFAGRSFIQSRSATIRADEASVAGTAVPAALRIDIERLRPAKAATYGARAGYWFGMVGIAVDAATLDFDVRRQRIVATGNLRFDESVFGERVTIDPGRDVAVDIPRVSVPTTATVAALAMVRLPHARLQPYAFAGPAYVVTDTDLSGDFGVRAGAGVRFALTRTIGVFGEYRYTGINATAVAGRISGMVAETAADSGDIKVGLKLRNHAAVGGIGLRF